MFNFPAQKFLRPAFVTLGILFIACVFLYRVPGLYAPLWEDEIHGNEPTLAFSRLSALRVALAPQYKPMLDFVIRKNIFSKKRGLTPTERDLKLFPLIFSTIHLLIILFFPWTQSIFPRCLAVILLSVSGIENAHATEAQYYSLTSLLGSAFFLGFYRILKSMELKKEWNALWQLLLWTFLVINTNFLMAPLIGAASLCFVFFVLFSEQEQKIRSIAVLCLGMAAAAWITYWINKPVIDNANSTIAAEVAKTSFPFKTGLMSLSWNYSFVGIPASIFYLGMVLAVFHPDKRTRKLSYALALSLTLFKFIFYTYFGFRSNLRLFERYAIMYIGPSIMIVGIGWDSLYLNLRRFIPNFIVVSILLIVLFFNVRVHASKLLKILSCPPTNLKLLRTSPANGSPSFLFFEEVKRLNAPVLVITNHCYGVDIPSFYLTGRIGKDFNQEVVIVDTKFCSKSKESYSNDIRSFLKSHKEDGYVVYYFDSSGEEALSGCSKGWPAVSTPMNWCGTHRNDHCFSIHRALDVKPPLIN